MAQNPTIARRAIPLSDREIRTVGMPTEALGALPARVEFSGPFRVEGRINGANFEFEFNPRGNRFLPITPGPLLSTLTPVDRGHLRNLGSALRGAVDLITTTGNARKLEEQLSAAATYGVALTTFNDELRSAGISPVTFEPREDNHTSSNSPVSVAENAVSKAMTYAALAEDLGRTGRVMADDIGVFVRALDGFPGADFKLAAKELTGLVQRRAEGEEVIGAALKHRYLAPLLDHVDTVVAELRRELGNVPAAFQSESLAVHYESVFMRALAAHLRAHPKLPRDAFMFSCIATKAPGEHCETHYGRLDVRCELNPRGKSEFPLDAWCSINGTRMTEMAGEATQRPSARGRAMMSLFKDAVAGGER